MCMLLKLLQLFLLLQAGGRLHFHRCWQMPALPSTLSLMMSSMRSIKGLTTAC